MTTKIEKELKKIIDKEAETQMLCQKQHMTFNHKLSANICLDIIAKYPNQTWNWHIILRRNDITHFFAEKFIDKHFTDYTISSLIKNKNINIFNLIEKYPDYNYWPWGDIFDDKNITLEIVSKYINKVIDKRYIFTRQHKNIKNVDLIRKFPNYNWEGIIRKLSKLEAYEEYDEYGYYHKLIDDYYENSIEYILDNKDIKWNWNKITKRQNIKIDYILANLHLPWNLEYINEKDNIKLEYIKSHPELPWDLHKITNRIQNLTYDYIKKNINKNWDWIYIYIYKNLKHQRCNL